MTDTAPRPGYMFPHTWEGEAERLAGLTALLDPGTLRHLEALGIGSGWRCLEVGAGSGTIARWMAERVGPTGSVLATDVSTGLASAATADLANVEVRRHDITAEGLGGEMFDLIHSRVVLEHLRGRDRAVVTLVDALAPGGWLLIEDMAWTSGTGGGRARLVGAAVMRALPLVMRRHGWDPLFGARLPVLLGELGLTGIGAEGRSPVIIGGSEERGWWRPSIERFGALMAEEPGLSRLLRRPLRATARLLDDRRFCWVVPPIVATWGRRPA